jgi:hypothetical protein
MADGTDFLSGILDKYGRDYITWLFAIITDPQSIIAKTREVNGKGEYAQYLLPILIVSIFLGATIGALIPNRPPFQSRVAIFCVVSILWLFMSQTQSAIMPCFYKTFCHVRCVCVWDCVNFGRIGT